MPVTFCATQPAICVICHASGSAIATAPMSIVPRVHSQIAAVAVAVTMVAFITVSVSVNAVVSRSWRMNVPVCWSTASRTCASSSRAVANSFTVRMFV